MRTFTLIAAAAAIALGLATAPAMAGSFSFSYSTGSHKTPKHYRGSGYNHGYKYGYKYGYQKPYIGRYYDRRGNYRHDRFARPRFGFGRHNYGYTNYGYRAPKLSKHKLLRRLRRQNFSRVKSIHFSRGFYSVFARDRYGRKVKLRVDPYTGRVVAGRYHR